MPLHHPPGERCDECDRTLEPTERRVLTTRGGVLVAVCLACWEKLTAASKQR